MPGLGWVNLKMCGNWLVSDSFEVLLDFPGVALDYGLVLLEHLLFYLPELLGYPRYSWHLLY